MDMEAKYHYNEKFIAFIDGVYTRLQEALAGGPARFDQLPGKAPADLQVNRLGAVVVGQHFTPDAHLAELSSAAR